MVHLFQRWLFNKGKSKNSAVVQSTWSSVHARILKKKYVLMPVTECLDSKRKGKQARSNYFLLLSLLYKLPQKGVVQIKVDLTAPKKSRYAMGLST